jgi:hypothetical protein
MSWEAIGAIGSIVGSVAVVCTLAYLALQMKQNTKALTTSMYETAMGGFNEVIGFLNNDPTTSSLMRRGWLDPSSLSVEESYRFSMLVRYYSNHVYKLFRLYEGGVPSARVEANCTRGCTVLLLVAGWRRLSGEE